ncbi:MAG: hypothetical protein LYZ69_01365 [Nitrososphaerales archaeon]|nr:hypothetical protein [Nitrososphaerales archaeon]
MRGRIFDLYPGRPGEMVVWLKEENGDAVRLVDSWSPSIYIAADNRTDLETPLKTVGEELAWTRVVRRRERVTDRESSEVVEAKVRDAKRLQQVAGRIERLGPFGAFRAYNVDVPPSQSYLYERDLFPLAYCEVEQRGNRLEWMLEDDVWAYDYCITNLRKVKVDVQIEKQGMLARFTDPLKAVTLESDNGKVVIEGRSEADMILDIVKAVKEADPDFVLTTDGDTFLFPYLTKRAEASGVAGRLALDRDGTLLTLPARKGTSYFSYGRIHYKPSAMKLYGRLHIDVNTSFAFSEAGFEGLFELSRLCRMPLQTSSRATIGKALSSLQCYNAFKMGLLVPWKPTLAEHFKTRAELLVADRGGFIFEPKMGMHEGIAEFDYSALYPNIMLRKNISAETVKCSCCPDSKNRVPELNWNVCEERTGIIAKSMEIVVGKRLRYKELKGSATGTERKIFDERQAVLKWVGCVSFGYLGHSNAKFGRIDAHIAVCAWDRKTLIDTARIAERRGYEVIHGIVDSLWLKRDGADETDYLELKREIEEEIGFPLSFEGIYKWVTFLPSKVDPGLAVLNRYFGAYRSGALKVRGIEARRRDTPLLFKRCQMEILTRLAKADTIKEAREMLPECVEVFLKYASMIESREASADEMAFAMNLSKEPEEYVNRTLQASVAKQLVGEGVELHAGEGIRYVIRDYGSGGSKRAVPFDFWEAKDYDPRRYVRLLAEACATVLREFDSRCDVELLVGRHEHGHGLVDANMRKTVGVRDLTRKTWPAC